MNNKLKRWEAALMVGVAVAMLVGAVLEQEHTDLAGRIIRLHVIANSDSPEDQALKLQVRDEILECAAAIYKPEDDMQTACRRLSGQLSALQQAGEQAVRERGYTYPVQVTLGSTHFPTKQYENFALPAGEYTALRVVIGEGAGENWWCVAFPPLCLGGVTETVDEAAAAGHFAQRQVSLITGESEGYVVKFKAMELWDRFKSCFD